MDPELEQIRQKRIAELQNQQSRAREGGPQTPQGQQALQADAQAAEEKRAEMRANILAQILSGPARERLARVALVKPTRARQAEEILIQQAQTGQLRQKLDENQVVALLDQLAQHSQPANKVIYDRRASTDDDGDFDGLDGFYAKGNAQGAGGSGGHEDDDDDFFD